MRYMRVTGWFTSLAEHIVALAERGLVPLSLAEFATGLARRSYETELARRLEAT